MNDAPDFQPLLEPVQADAPSGDDLEYSPAYAAVMQAVAGRAEQQIGELIVPATEPDWADVAAQCQALLMRTHDLRIAARWAQALLHRHGVAGLAAGLGLLRGWVDQEWDTLYPKLDVEDGLDPAIRLNALSLLTHPAALLHPLRTRPLLDGTAVSLLALQQAQGAEAVIDESLPGAAAIDAAFDAAPITALLDLSMTAQQALDDAQSLQQALMDRVGAVDAPDLAPLCRLLTEIESRASRQLDRRTEPAAAASPDAWTSAPPSASSEVVAAALDNAPGPAPVHSPDEPSRLATLVTPLPQPSAPAWVDPSSLTTLRSRADAVRALEAVTRWFVEHEPSHPVPLLLERAQRWIGMDYLALLQDLAPEAAEQALRLRGPSY